MPTVTISVPAKVVGAVVGKNNVSLSWIAARTGAVVKLEQPPRGSPAGSPCTCVITSRDSSSLESARTAVNDRIATAKAADSALDFEHPVTALCVFSPAFGDGTGAYFEWFCDKVDGHKTFSQHVVHTRAALPPASPWSTYDLPAADGADAIASMLGTASLDAARTFYLSASLPAVFDRIFSLLSSQPSSMTAKIRVNLGRQLFMNKHDKPLPSIKRAGDLERLVVAHPFKTEYSNFVAEADAARISSRAILPASRGGLGFELVEHRNRVSAHLASYDGRGITLRFVGPSEKDATLTDANTTLSVVKAANKRTFFLAVIEPRQIYSSRMKLMRTDAIGGDGAFEKAAGKISYAQVRAAGAVPLGEIRGGEVPLRCDSTRVKRKVIFDGEFEGDQMRLSVIQVKDKDGAHWEVAVANKTWNELIRGGSEDEKEAKGHFVRTIRFADKVSRLIM